MWPNIELTLRAGVSIIYGKKLEKMQDFMRISSTKYALKYTVKCYFLLKKNEITDKTLNYSHFSELKYNIIR